MSLYTRPSQDTGRALGDSFLPGNRRHYLSQDDPRLQTKGTKERRNTMQRTEERKTMLADDEMKMQPRRPKPQKKFQKDSKPKKTRKKKKKK